VWEKQARLNRRVGIDTLALSEECVDGRQSEAVMRAAKDYLLALADEYHELQNCLLWKFWTREAREGNRWAIHDFQNALVEVTDILFFTMSLAQLAAPSGPVREHLKSLFHLMEPLEPNELSGASIMGTLAIGQRTVWTSYMQGFTTSVVEVLISVWASLSKLLGLSQEAALRLYDEKWLINWSRQERGYQQIGDPLAAGENLTIGQDGTAAK